MSSYGFGSSGGGSGYSVPAGGGAPKGGGFWHDLGQGLHDVAALPEHLASDIGNAAIQIPTGLYTLGKTAVEHPSQLPALAEGVLKQYESFYTLSHPIALLQHMYAHPLQPILDALTVADLGSTAAVQGARLLGDAGEAGSMAARVASLGDRSRFVVRSPRAIQTGTGPTIERLSSARPITKIRQLVVNKMTKAFDDYAQARKGTRPFENRAYGKGLQRIETQHALGRLQVLPTYEKAFAKMKPDERLAMQARSMDIHPEDLQTLWAGTKNGSELTPEVQRLMLEPSENMQKAETIARGLSESGAELLKLRGALSEESELTRPGRFKEQAGEMLGRPVQQIHGDPYYIPHVTEPVKGSHPMADVGGGKAEPKAPGSTKQNLGQLFAQGKLDLANDVLGPEFARRVKWLKFWGIHNGLKRGAIRASFDELHAMHGSGRAPAGYDFLRTSIPQTRKGELLSRINRLERIQDRRPTPEREAKLKELYAEHAPYVLGDKPDYFVGMQKQKIPASIRGEGTHAMLMPDPEDLQNSIVARHGFTTDDIHQAATDEQGRYYLVPKATARAATGEFTRMNSALYHFNRYPLRWWRSLLLGARPAFLVNNLLGNSVMYAMKTGGRGAVRDLFQAMHEAHGDKLAMRLLRDPSTPADVRAELENEFRFATHYPEQTSLGTFNTTQSPSTEGMLRGYSSKAGQRFQKATSILPHVTSKVAEEAPRRALVRNFIRNSPEFKQVWNALPAEARSFRAAAKALHEGKGGAEYQRMISEQVDRSIGNYTHLNPFERNVMRNALPFYSWYRAIVQTTFHLAVDSPLRAQLLFKLGQIGGEAAAKGLALPSYLQGSIPLGPGPNGVQRLLYTQSLNPYATLQQLGSGSMTDITSLGLNPFAQGLLTTFASLSNAPGRTGAQRVSPGALLQNMLKGIVMGLPPMAQAFPAGPSTLYPNRGRGSIPFIGPRESALLSWLGVPIKEVNPSVAMQRAAAGQ